MTIDTDRDLVVARLLPGVVLRLHDVTVHAGFWIGLEVRKAFCVAEGVAADASGDAQTHGERERQNTRCARRQRGRRSRLISALVLPFLRQARDSSQVRDRRSMDHAAATRSTIRQPGRSSDRRATVFVTAPTETLQLEPSPATRAALIRLTRMKQLPRCSRLSLRSSCSTSLGASARRRWLRKMAWGCLGCLGPSSAS